MKTLVVAVLLFAGCVTATEDVSSIDRKPRHDAGVDALIPDAPSLSTPGVIACFTEGAPNNTCAPGIACNFNNYNSYHDGFCSNSYPQTYGLETCDGPEDCSTGSNCCVVMGYAGDMIIVNIGCQASACAVGNGDFEMCHPTSNAWGTCSDTSKHCVSAPTAGQYSIAANLYVCN